MSRIGFGQLGCSCRCKKPVSHCEGCKDFAYPAQPAQGMVLSTSRFLYCEPGWNLASFRTVGQQYRCGFWRIVALGREGCNPLLKDAGTLPVIASGCITPTGELTGLPDSIQDANCWTNQPYWNWTWDKFNPASPMPERYAERQITTELCLVVSAPKKVESGAVPHHWPTVPTHGQIQISHEQYEFLARVNLARTHPQQWYSQTIASTTATMITARDPRVTTALNLFTYPTPQSLAQYWPSATPVPAVKFNSALNGMGTWWALYMDQWDSQWYPIENSTGPYKDRAGKDKYTDMTPRQFLDQCGYVGFPGPLTYCYSKDYYTTFTPASYAACAFILDWGVPGNEHRERCRNGAYTDIGSGVLYRFMGGGRQTGPYIYSAFIGHDAALG